MNDKLTCNASTPSSGDPSRGSIATSLFGGAMLATVATASFGQVTYFPTAAALSMGTGFR